MPHTTTRWFLATASAIVAFASLATASLAAEPPAPLVKNGDAETGGLDNWNGFSAVSDQDPHGGKFCFLHKSSAAIMSKELIPVQPGKVYTLTGWFKSAGEEESVIYFGYVPLNENRRIIGPANVKPVAGSDTTLVQPCAKDDLVIKIADGSKWKALAHGCAAFDTEPSGEYKDLPNFNLSSFGIQAVEKMDDCWEVTLKTKCGQERPAGAPVRMHLSGGSYIYNAAGNARVPNEWKQFKGVIKGHAASDAPSSMWWPGTKYVQILILANYGQKDTATLLADDITLTETDE